MEEVSDMLEILAEMIKKV